MGGGRQLRKKLVKFCPACGETVKIPPKDWVTCGGCWLVFTVRVGLLPPTENGSTQGNECGIKRKHESKEAAVRHAAELRDIPNRTWEQLCVYQCRFCKSWHAIRREYVPRKNVAELATRYGIKPKNISRIAKGQRWAWL